MAVDRTSALATPVLKGLMRDVICHFVASRMIFLGGYLMAVIMLAPAGPHDDINRTGAIALPGFGAMRQIVELSATRYGDFGWYSKIATQGYEATPYVPHSHVQHDWVYFPLQAWLIARLQRPAFCFAFAMIIGLAGSLMTAVVIAQMFSLEVAGRAMPYLLYFPFSYMLSQYRPESLLFFFVALALFMRGPLALWRARLPITLFALLAAGFTKPNGFLVGVFWIPNVLAGLRARRLSPGMLAAAAPCVGIVVMSVWMYAATGAPLAWAQGQFAWGASLIGTPLAQIHGLLTQPMLIDRYGWDPTLLEWFIWAGMWVSAGLLAARGQFLACAFLLATSLLSFVNFGVWVQGKHVAGVFAYAAGLAQIRLSDAMRGCTIAVLAGLLAAAGILTGAGFHSFIL